MSKTSSALVEIVRIALPVAIVGAGIAGFIMLSKAREVPVRAAEPEGAPLVECVAAENYSGTLDITSDGIVVPYREVELAAEVAGRIIDKSPECRAGNYVTAGVPLFTIDPRDYELEVKRLQEELNKADVSIQEAEVEIENAQGLIELAEQDLELQIREVRRIEGLAGRSAATDSEIDQVKRSELSARNTLRTLRNQMKMAETRRRWQERAKDHVATQLDLAKLHLQRTAVVAPFDGVVVRESAEKDSYVQKGTSLVTVEDTSAVEVKCNLRVEELYWLWQQAAPESAPAAPGMNYRLPRTDVTVEYQLAGRRYAWRGVLSRYDGIGLDEKTRTVPCRVIVEDPRAVALVGEAESAAATQGPPALVRGMYVSVQMHAQPSVGLVGVPEQALRPGDVLWLVRDGKLVIQHVRIADTVNGLVLLHAAESGLSANDRVIVSPLAVVQDGMEVRDQAFELTRDDLL